MKRLFLDYDKQGNIKSMAGICTGQDFRDKNILGQKSQTPIQKKIKLFDYLGIEQI